MLYDNVETKCLSGNTYERPTLKNKIIHVLIALFSWTSSHTNWSSRHFKCIPQTPGHHTNHSPWHVYFAGASTPSMHCRRPRRTWRGTMLWWGCWRTSTQPSLSWSTMYPSSSKGQRKCTGVSFPLLSVIFCCHIILKYVFGEHTWTGWTGDWSLKEDKSSPLCASMLC